MLGILDYIKKQSQKCLDIKFGCDISPLTLNVEVGGGDNGSTLVLSCLSQTLIHSCIFWLEVLNPQNRANTHTADPYKTKQREIGP